MTSLLEPTLSSAKRAETWRSSFVVSLFDLDKLAGLLDFLEDF